MPLISKFLHLCESRDDILFQCKAFISLKENSLDLCIYGWHLIFSIQYFTEHEHLKDNDKVSFGVFLMSIACLLNCILRLHNPVLFGSPVFPYLLISIEVLVLSLFIVY
ncbi:hypothetical protein SOMG_02560 [Schizosaccharomyces osmophilus]|uniref:Uncharacterized protein n=1 Tax=Schizosaccharomyces osmophilus TaxID=2545709 RepID=A0AAE9WDW3_9SCHI|nr:uncharacterized protein SOMG_02560 [Schizosaccharomyces osmophilus]WBW74591.1 hypothetical protein SOMG_02560 [Schizosaccharomyces osmophilus]